MSGLRCLVCLFVLSLLTLVTTGCSTTDKKAVYENSRKTVPLEVPPDLTQPGSNDAMALPSIATQDATFSAYQDLATGGVSKLLPHSVKGIRLLRDGALSWLEIQSTPEDLWPKVRRFLTDVGFEIKVDIPQLGYMETNWLENRADVPTNWLSKMLNKLYSTGYLDMYRVRLERTEEADKTLMFISHRGMREEADNEGGSEVVSTVWESRPSDPELEVEMLQRFVVFSGVQEDIAERHFAQIKVNEKFVLRQQDDKTILEIRETFSRSWRRVGLALDRLGMIVMDRNRTSGVYYIQLPESFREESEKGWWASWFADDKKDQEKEFLLSLNDQGEHVLVTVQGRQGKQIDADTSHHILSKIQSHMK